MFVCLLMHSSTQTDVWQIHKHLLNECEAPRVLETKKKMPVFVPVPYCLDDCGFVVEPEVWQVDSSSSILLSQDCFGYSRFFVFPYKL